MGTMTVVVSEVLAQDVLELSATEDEEPVQALPAQRADDSLADGVGLGCSDRGRDDLDALGGKDGIEAGGELGIPVSGSRNGTRRTPRPAPGPAE
jgi:hypothetical protein